MRICAYKLLEASLLLIAGSVLLIPINSSFAVAQTVQQAPDAGERHSAFEVVSIRQSAPGGQPHFGATATGYQATNLPLMASVLMAYLPLSGEAYYTGPRIQGAPDWAMSERYAIDAKVSDADAAEWQKPEVQKVMLRSMLQAMLANRCKLAVHRENKETTVFELMLSKGGPKFKEAVPDAQHPAGISLPSGGTLVPSKDGQTLSFYAVPMASLTPVLANFAGRPVRDKTGLTGRYDLTLERDSPAPSDSGAPTGPPTYAVEAMGLHLQKSTASVDTLVIDHMERPTGN